MDGEEWHITTKKRMLGRINLTKLHGVKHVMLHGERPYVGVLYTKAIVKNWITWGSTEQEVYVMYLSVWCLGTLIG